MTLLVARLRMASALASHPSEDSAMRLAAAARAAGALVDGEPAGPDRELLATFAERELDQLEAEYVDLFDRGVAENPLHGTGYGRNRSHAVGERLADVAGFYRAFGVETTSLERHDHVAVELEFDAWMAAKEEFLEACGEREGAEIVLDARRKFLAEHLGPLARAIAGRPTIRASAAYGPLFAWIDALVGAECERLGVAIEPLEIVPGRSEPDEVTCAPACAKPAGGGRLPVLADA